MPEVASRQARRRRRTPANGISRACLRAPLDYRELGQVLLNESRAQVYVQLDERFIADAAEAVNLPRLDDENVAGPGLEFFFIHDPDAAAFPNELDFVVRMDMGAGTIAGRRPKDECRDADVTVYGPNKWCALRERAAHLDERET